MARKNEAKVTFLASTEQFTAAIDESKSAIGRLNAQLKKNSAEMRGNGEDAQSLGRRVELLAQKHAEQANVVENMRRRLEAAKAAYGENSAEVGKMETQLASAEATLQGYANQLDRARSQLSSAESAYGQLTAAISRQESELSQLEREYASAVVAKGKDSAEARQLEGRIGSLSTELRQNRDRMESAEQAARQLSTGLGKVESSARGAAGGIADVAAGNVLADAASSAASSLAALDEATQENRVNMTRLELAYQSSGRAADEARETYRSLYAVLGDGDQAAEAALDMRNLADAGADVGEWLTIAAGASTAFGDALPVENLIESANETVRCGQVTGGLADAINWTTISQEALNQRMSEHPAVMEAYNAAISEGASQEDAMNAALAACGDEQERAALLTSALGIQYSDLGAQFEEANQTVADARLATDDLAQAQSDLADEIAPLKSDVTELAAEGIGFLADNLDIAVPVVLGLATAFGVATIASGGLSIAVGALNVVMSLNPAVLLAAAIAGIVVAIALLWQNCEEFREFWKGVWDEICSAADQAKLFFDEVKNGFVSALCSIRDWANETWEGFTGSVTSAVDGAKQKVADFKDGIVSKFAEIKDGITDKINGARDAVDRAVDTIKGFFDFSWSLPHINLPHFSVSGGEAPWGFMGKGSLPKVSVSWYARAMDSAVVLSSPTIFGAAGGSLLGAGEAGREVVSGEAHLLALMEQAVRRAAASVSNHTEVNVTVNAVGGADEIADAAAAKVLRAVDQAYAANGR